MPLMPLMPLAVEVDAWGRLKGEDDEAVEEAY